MLDKWNDEIAAKVAKHRESILSNPRSKSETEVVIRTNGIPVYGDLGGVIALTMAGNFVLYDDWETVTPVSAQLWVDVALASLAKRYPDLYELLPGRPEVAGACANCTGTGWMMDGKLFCRRCRGLGWVVESDSIPVMACDHDAIRDGATTGNCG